MPARLGRPKKGAEKNRTKMLSFRVSDAAFDALKKLAKRRRLTRSELGAFAIDRLLADERLAAEQDKRAA